MASIRAVTRSYSSSTARAASIRPGARPMLLRRRDRYSPFTNHCQCAGWVDDATTKYMRPIGSPDWHSQLKSLG